MLSQDYQCYNDILTLRVGAKVAKDLFDVGLNESRNLEASKSISGLSQSRGFRRKSERSSE